MRVALCLHGRASGAASAERVDKEQSCKTEPHFNLSIAANMRLAHDGLWRYFILANRNAGHEVGVFLHSWSPDAAPLLDELYRPVASLHEPPQRLNKARSQHLSARRPWGKIQPALHSQHRQIQPTPRSQHRQSHDQGSQPTKSFICVQSVPKMRFEMKWPTTSP